MNLIEIITSADGSSTIYNSALNETYHSRYGAITESLHVFIENGFKKLFPFERPVKLLEIGLGTGLNVLLTYQHALATGQHVEYHTLEPYPLDTEIIDALNYELQLGNSALTNKLSEIHNCAWVMNFKLGQNFTLVKHPVLLQHFTSPVKFDLIYFDAFGPTKQPDMWTLENFLLLNQVLDPGGILVSYCASGQFRRNLLAAGFTYTSVPGPPGKKEMTFALKPY